MGKFCSKLFNADVFSVGLKIFPSESTRYSIKYAVWAIISGPVPPTPLKTIKYSWFCSATGKPPKTPSATIPWSSISWD